MANEAFSIFISDLLKKEGGYVNNSNDSGGETNYGITIATARAFGYKGKMSELPRTTAMDIYKQKYWDVLGLDTVQGITASVALSVADTAVNMGPKTAGMFLQRSLNLYNLRGQYYPDLAVDGEIGLATIKALGAFMARRPKDGELVLCRTLNIFKGMKYIMLAEAREKDEDFIYGWILNRVV